MTVTRVAFLVLAAAALASCAHKPGIALVPGLAPGNLGRAGLSSDRVEALRTAYGTPQLVRKEVDSELWRYDGTNCAAFFFLYTVNGALHVRHVETLPRGQSEPIDLNCLKSIRTRASATS
jgi:hypothetical protein